MKAIGIDLGTTNCAVTRYDAKRKSSAVLLNSEGDRLTPSVVATRVRDGDESTMVGNAAVNFAGVQPTETVFSVKRLMGRDFADRNVAQARERLNYAITTGPDEDARAHVLMAGRAHTPADISGLILTKLRRDAARTLGSEVTHAVITVPAYFQDAQRAATREAGTKAGLVVKKIVDEPTAAALAYGLEIDERDHRRVLVYDLGGGTFDISILQVAKDRRGQSHFQVLEYNGDSWLGGDDFDGRIVERIIERIKEKAGLDPSGDKKFLLLAKQHAEAAKRTLSSQDEADIHIPAAYTAPGGFPVDLSMTLTRSSFDAMIAPLVDRTMTLVREAMDRQSLTRDEISDVLLVGGSTLTPQVYRAVEEYFGAARVRRDISPMECVALGAGILAGTMNGVACPVRECDEPNEEDAASCELCGTSLAEARPLESPRLYEVTGLAMGIAAVRGEQRDVFAPIIPRGTPYPLPEPKCRTFQATDGKFIRVPVYEGDHAVASRNKEQGVVEWELPEEIDATRRVEVSFNYDADRIVKVRISVPGTSMHHETELRTDTYRTSPAPAPAESADDGEVWREDLHRAVDDVRSFLRSHGKYMEPAQEMKIEDDLKRAQQTQHFPDGPECRRMANILRAHLFGSGIASHLLLAERAAEAASPDLARSINEAASGVRRSHEDKQFKTAHEQARVLNTLVSRAFNSRGVAEVPDEVVHGGLLKLLDE